MKLLFSSLSWIISPTYVSRKLSISWTTKPKDGEVECRLPLSGIRAKSLIFIVQSKTQQDAKVSKYIVDGQK